MPRTPKRPAKPPVQSSPGATPPSPPASAIEPHARLRDQQGKLLGGIVRRDGEWVLGMDGQIAGSSEQAAPVFALIRRAGHLHEAAGTPVRLTWSDELMAAVDAELGAQGITLEQFEKQLQLGDDHQAE